MRISARRGKLALSAKRKKLTFRPAKFDKVAFEKKRKDTILDEYNDLYMRIKRLQNDIDKTERGLPKNHYQIKVWRTRLRDIRRLFSAWGIMSLELEKYFGKEATAVLRHEIPTRIESLQVSIDNKVKQ